MIRSLTKNVGAIPKASRSFLSPGVDHPPNLPPLNANHHCLQLLLHKMNIKLGEWSDEKKQKQRRKMPLVEKQREVVYLLIRQLVGFASDNSLLVLGDGSINHETHSLGYSSFVWNGKGVPLMAVHGALLGDPSLDLNEIVESAPLYRTAIFAEFLRTYFPDKNVIVGGVCRPLTESVKKRMTFDATALQRMNDSHSVIAKAIIKSSASLKWVDSKQNKVSNFASYVTPRAITPSQVKIKSFSDFVEELPNFWEKFRDFSAEVNEDEDIF